MTIADYSLLSDNGTLTIESVIKTHNRLYKKVIRPFKAVPYNSYCTQVGNRVMLYISKRSKKCLGFLRSLLSLNLNCREASYFLMVKDGTSLRFCVKSYDKLSIRAVSYTHLTLPTIYSV